MVALQEQEGAVFRFEAVPSPDFPGFPGFPEVQVSLSPIANPRLKRNGDLGADPPGVFEAAQPSPFTLYHSSSFVFYLVLRLDSIDNGVSQDEAQRLFDRAEEYNRQLASRIQFSTPDAYINTLGSALSMAADGDWDGQTWLHGCIGWRMPLAGWRAAYVGDVLGWHDRQRSHRLADSVLQSLDCHSTHH